MLKFKNSVIVALVLATLVGFGTTYVTKVRSVNSLPQEKKMTNKQKEHSKLYKEDFKSRKGKKLTNIAATGIGNVSVIIPVADGFQLEPTTPLNLHGFLKNLICDADAVVIGTVKSKSSHLTEEEEFIFTDYEMTVEEVLKDNSAASIQSRNIITATRGGGVLKINGRNVIAIDESLKPLEVNSRYLLFLRFVPNTSAYKAHKSKGSVQLNDHRIIKLTGEAVPRELDTGGNAATLINGIRSVVLSNCAKEDEK